MKKKCLYLLFSTLCCFVVVSCSSHDPSKPSRSEVATLFSPAMKKEMPYSVYLPPGWEPSESLPLVVLLHGARDNYRTFDKYQVGEYLDERILAGDVPRAIIVNPEGGLGFWENWYDGTYKYRDWVIKDLMPVIATKYGTLPCPEHCHVTGISMGAHGAMRFGYYEPEVFSSIAAISGLIISKKYKTKTSWTTAILKWLLPTKRIWGDISGKGDRSHIPKDLDPYVSWVSKPEMAHLRFFMSWGDRDSKGILHSNTMFQSHLEKHKRPHSWYIYEGQHKWRDWKAIIADSLRFHVDGKSTSATVYP